MAAGTGYERPACGMGGPLTAPNEEINPNNAVARPLTTEQNKNMNVRVRNKLLPAAGTGATAER